MKAGAIKELFVTLRFIIPFCHSEHYDLHNNNSVGDVAFQLCEVPQKI